jgi:hypothetical protein
MFLASLKKAEARGFTSFIVCFMGKILLAPLFKGGWGDLIVWVIWHYLKNNFKRNVGHHLLEDSQMPLGINSAAKASDNDGTHIGEGANDAPGMQPL